MAGNKGLGRGFASLLGLNDADDINPINISDTVTPTSDDAVVAIPLTDIDPNFEQPRKNFDEDALNELAESIKLHGVIQPIVVVPVGRRFMIIAGERRFRASKIAGKTSIPAVIRHYTSQQIKEISLIENLQREDLNPYEEAKAYLATVTKIIAAHTTIMNTHNPLLDALLSKKYEEATCKGVMLYFDLPDLRAIPLEKTDLVMVVSNLLNNAIDAAAQADPPEVYFRMRKTEEELLLSVRNRVRKDLDLPDGQLPRSTKKEPGHGIGLWNVTDVLRKYQGEYAISCRDKWFRFTCSVPVHRI